MSLKLLDDGDQCGQEHEFHCLLRLVCPNIQDKYKLERFWCFFFFFTIIIIVIIIIIIIIIIYLFMY